ncbi:MAG: hypothetical protein ABSF62_21825 [Bryobacteraceae bacterium]
MSTQAQIGANRRNSQQSTGPRTAEGKAASSRNAFKSGLDADSQFCYGEQREDFYRLQVEYFTRFSPQSPEERFYVDTLLRNEWSLRRLFRAEAHLWEFNTSHASRRDGAPLGEGFHNSSPVFMRLHRRITLFEKSYREALADLRALQEARLAAPEAPARATEEELTYPGPKIFVIGDDLPQPSPPATPAGSSASPEIGFVPESVGQAPSPAPDPLVRPSESPTEPAGPASTNPEIGFVPPIPHQSSNVGPADRPSFSRPSRFQPRT